MKRLLRWLYGYIRVSLRGRQINRFLNLCSRHGIGLWNVSRHMEHYVQAHMHLRDFYLLKPFLRKTRTTLRVLGRYGFPFWCYRHPRLKWFPVFVMAIVCVVLYSSTFIWNVEVYGNNKVSDQDIIDFLESREIGVGKKINVINCAQLEYDIRQSFENLGWVTVYIDRTNLCVEVRESLYGVHENMVSKSGRYELVANKDALIHSIVTRTGIAVVENKMRVKAGDVLVEGRCEIKDDSGTIREELQLRADAQIIADVEYLYVEPLTEMEIMALKIAGLYTDEMINYIGNVKFNRFLENLEENGVIILDKNVMIEKEDKQIYFLGKIYAREEIGIHIPVEELSVNEFE